MQQTYTTQREEQGLTVSVGCVCVLMGVSLKVYVGGVSLSLVNATFKLCLVSVFYSPFPRSQLKSRPSFTDWSLKCCNSAISS